MKQNVWNHHLDFVSSCMMWVSASRLLGLDHHLQATWERGGEKRIRTETHLEKGRYKPPIVLKRFHLFKYTKSGHLRLKRDWGSPNICCLGFFFIRVSNLRFRKTHPFKHLFQPGEIKLWYLTNHLPSKRKWAEMSTYPTKRKWAQISHQCSDDWLIIF